MVSNLLSELKVAQKREGEMLVCAGTTGKGACSDLSTASS